MPNFEFSDEEKQLIDTAREFARKEIVPVAGEMDEHGTFPAEICKKAWETGLMNCEIPESMDDLSLTCLAHCLVLEEISYGCTGVNTTLAANMLGTMPIMIAGTDAQKKEYLGRLLRHGREVEADAGDRPYNGACPISSSPTRRSS